MKNFIISVLLAVTSFTNVLSQSWVTSSQISSTNDIVVIQSTINNVGEVIVFGYFLGTLTSNNGQSIDSYGDRDYFLIKFNTDGGVVWMKAIGSELREYLSGGVGIDQDNNIYVSGGFQSYLKYSDSDSIQSTGVYDAFIVKYDDSGNALWARNCGAGALFQGTTALEVSPTGNLLISGIFIDSINIQNIYSLYTGDTSADYFYAELSPIDGTVQWIEHIRSLNLKNGAIWDIARSPESYAMAGFFYDSIGFTTDTIAPYNDNQDVHLISTDHLGNINWVRKISGNARDLSYSVVFDDENNIYIAGYYNSDTLSFFTSSEDSVTVYENNGTYDLFIAKYLSSGSLDWYKVMGSNGEDKVFDIEFFDDKIYLSGYFSDTLNWGGINLISEGIGDRDMFTGALDKDGNYRDANSYHGRNNSSDEAWSIFKNVDELFTVMRSNSDMMILGDSIYTADKTTFGMYIGVIGCLPISVDQTIPRNVAGCYGDSTGSIQVVASGGFGSPWQYSIDNGLNYSTVAYYDELPAGDYQVVVIDAENCAEVGPLVTLTQPDTLLAQFVSKDDILHHTDWRGDVDITDGSLVVSATGGTGPYTFQLIPGGSPQALGTYTFTYADSGKYVVAVNDINGCGPSETDTIEINVIRTSAVGVDDFEGAGVKIYPNPTAGILTLEMPFEGGVCDMEVLNMTGQVVLKRQVYPSGGIINETLDLSDKAKGLYMLKINGEALRSAIMVK
ncbi:MAG: T9SS type A sorting domain-containing protein [Bacteroidales bacterium]|nr:T9SS type A sorting domain-containing protein [Bacteroidales bacterium]